MTSVKYVYGPVCSRRLGRSLGIDLVPFKVCSYDCIYCQLGHTTNLTLSRKEYISTDAILEELRKKLAQDPAPDFITLAGSGEPTLNTGLGYLIEEIHQMSKIPVAVLTNGSLLWMPEIRNELMQADLVIPSLDAGDEALFQHVNRPHRNLSFNEIVNGLAVFSREFSGRFWLEVFLLAGITGILCEVKKIAALVERIQPERVQLNTVARPPVEDFAFSVAKAKLNQFASLFSVPVDVISESPMEETISASVVPETADNDILTLLSRRPCPLTEISAGLRMPPNEALKHLQRLIQHHTVTTIYKNGLVFYQAVRVS